MTGPDLFAALRDQIIGMRIAYRRLAANTLFLYIGCDPGDKQGITIKFDPTWNLESPGGVLTGSRQAQHDEEAEEPDAGFSAACSAVNVIVGRLVKQVVHDPVTGDIRLMIEGGLLVQTFVSDPTVEELWHIRDNGTGIRVVGTPRGIEIDAPEQGEW